MFSRRCKEQIEIDNALLQFMYNLSSCSPSKIMTKKIHKPATVHLGTDFETSYSY